MQPSNSPTLTPRIQVKMIFDLEHRWISGERTDRFNVYWADGGGVLGKTIIVNGNRGEVKRDVNDVQINTPGFRVEATSSDAFFIDKLKVESGGVTLKKFDFEESNNDGFCLSTYSGDKFKGRCRGNKAFKCIDFCSDGSTKLGINCADKAIQCTLNEDEEVGNEAGLSSQFAGLRGALRATLLQEQLFPLQESNSGSEFEAFTLQDSNPGSNLEDALLGVKSLMEEGKIGAPFCIGDCFSDGLPYRQLKGSVEIIPSTNCNGVTLTCNTEMVTVTSTSYVLLKYIDQNVADSVVNVRDTEKLFTQRKSPEKILINTTCANP